MRDILNAVALIAVGYGFIFLVGLLGKMIWGL
jgi:hypothetical protein